MDDYTTQISLSALNSDYNGDITTTHDGLVTIKHEPQDIVDEHYPIQISSETSEFINNEPLMNHQEPTNYTERFKLKECYIRLEKCDKIWETLKVIKNLQTPVTNRNKNPKIAVKNVVQNQSPSPSPMLYQPTLNNGNSALPNFQFAIKSWKRLYTCTYCGKQYVDNRSLKAHLFKLHNVNPETDSPREIPSPIEIPRPLDIPRPKEIPQLLDLPRSSPKLGKRKVDPGKPFECNTCGAKYADARSLGSHSLRLHGILTEFHERWLSQQENPNDYTVEDLLKRHSCNSCGKRYSCTKSLRMHYLREHNFVLPPLRAGRRTLGQGPVSNLIHTGDMQKHMNICTICGKKYTKNWYLRVHCLEVHGIPMVCNRTKKSFTPAMRVIKKEVLDEPVPHKLVSTDMNFPLPQVKKEPQEPGAVPPIKNIAKRHQCAACKREFLTISKLRVHCMALHGIVIPRIRKPYKKSIFTMNKKGASLKIDPRTQAALGHFPEAGMMNAMQPNLNRSVNTSIETKIKPEARMVSTPKQVSLDRYFKSPTNGENIFQKTANTSQQNFAKRDRIPPRDLQDEPKETVKSATQQKAPANLIKCNLCSSNCKDIRKHYIAYHKIRYPETNVMKDLAASSDSTLESDKAEKASEKAPVKGPEKALVKAPEKVPELKKQPPRKRRRKFITMGRKKKRKIDNTPIEHQPLESTIPVIIPDTPTTPIKLQETQFLPKKLSPKLPSPTKTQFKCNICGGFYATPKSLKIHRQRHRTKGETKENIHLIAHNYKNMWKSQRTPESSNEDLDFNIGNDSRTSSNESITQSSSTSDSMDRLMKSTSRKIYSASETTCECGRGFRDPHTMYLHKDKCSSVNKIDRDKITVARSSSDRDSGIGISITIKKKNDSYEIVSRDSGDDDKSKDSSISKDSDQISHSSDSNFSNGVFNDRKFLDLIKGQCSKDHSVLKIEDADDDVDVDIEDDSQTNISDSENVRSVAKKELKSPRVSAEEEDDNFSRTVDPLDVDLYRCAICLELFKEMESLTIHMKLHESMRVIRQECPCGKTFRGAQGFLTHVEEYHPLWLQCGYCDVTFLNSKEYYSHSCEVNKEGKEFEDFQEIVCHYCSSKLRMTNFESHVTAHHFIAEKPFLCYFCKMRFSTKRQRTIHLTTEHAKPNCRICGQTLRFDFVAKHEAYHQGLGYPCHICKKAFASYRLMSSHQFDVHTRDDVKCNICKKSYTKRHIKYHMMSHAKKEKCKLCKRGFHSVPMLLNHIKAVHKNTYPFLKCDICSEKFIVESQLKNHFTQNLCKKNKKIKKLQVELKTAPKGTPEDTKKGTSETNNSTLENQSESAAENATEDTTKGTSETSISTAENKSESAAENATEDTMKGTSETNISTSENKSESAAENSTEDTTEDTTKRTSKTNISSSENKSESAGENTTERKTESAAENTADNTAESTAEITTENAAEDTTEEKTESAVENTTEENTTEGKTESAAEKTTEEETESASEDTTEEKTESATEDTTEEKTESAAESPTAVKEATEEDSLNITIKMETPANDENHSEMDESVEMDEPLALDPSSDMDGLLESAESTMHDIAEQNDSLEQEIIPPVDDDLPKEEKTPEEETEKATETIRTLNETEMETTTTTTEPTSENKSLDENSRPEKSREQLTVAKTLTEPTKDCDSEKEENEPSGIAETLESVANDSNEAINITDSFTLDDAETSLIDITTVNCNSTAKEIVTSMEIDCQEKSISESIENEMQVDT
ncbi:uncharacterized protein LOC122509135 [Leptopilina heterotoma]|uniref:uncharacterized protein LOC122509135 n=1 Tax=Leptopilina heterotoma TaxID=63436 RepID=UPI001CA89B3C|nr:uncharacterized protein LOC122509135 [Leptopilina heterotoma]